ncbi:hypothetical protein BCR33DRAFT_791827 [Rhizoclosmatium globosum]|uniref:Uncharacterized protein n=1 Tax=Rhizoclosmatium globosum TaxID=329046 RepID=A0A1Y2BDS3_9FUNG|nr:hypothetical protein BCR33DRAFT_791827 [Rhizoclosmatium globosum]|eukprot:ORY32215.1 hypothetical protein BCR33DRAFT_791827 [Rhizoclosmatium globosum]
MEPNTKSRSVVIQPIKGMKLEETFNALRICSNSKVLDVKIQCLFEGSGGWKKLPVNYFGGPFQSTTIFPKYRIEEAEHVDEFAVDSEATESLAGSETSSVSFQLNIPLELPEPQSLPATALAADEPVKRIYTDVERIQCVTSLKPKLPVRFTITKPSDLEYAFELGNMSQTEFEMSFPGAQIVYATFQKVKTSSIELQNGMNPRWLVVNRQQLPGIMEQAYFAGNYSEIEFCASGQVAALFFP